MIATASGFFGSIGLAATTLGLILADIDANGWVLIIGAIFLGISKIIDMILSHRRATLICQKVDNVAEKGEQIVKKTDAVQATVVRVTEDQNERLDSIASAVDSTNTLAGEIKTEVKNGKH